MTLERETLTVSHDGGSITFTGEEARKIVVQQHPLKRKLDRILHLTNEIRSLREDIATLYNDAKGEGYNVAALRRLARIMDTAQDPDKAAKMREVSKMLEIYANQMGQPLLPGMV